MTVAAYASRHCSGVCSLPSALTVPFPRVGESPPSPETQFACWIIAQSLPTECLLSLLLATLSSPCSSACRCLWVSSSSLFAAAIRPLASRGCQVWQWIWRWASKSQEHPSSHGSPTPSMTTPARRVLLRDSERSLLSEETKAAKPDPNIRRHQRLTGGRVGRYRCSCCWGSAAAASDRAGSRSAACASACA